MTSMLSNMTSWFAGIPPDDGQEEKVEVKTSDKAKEGAPGSSQPAENAEGQEGSPEGASQDPNIPPTQHIDFDEVAEKTLSAAKEWGTYFLSVGKAASTTAASTVAKHAQQLRDRVEEKVPV